MYKRLSVLTCSLLFLAITQLSCTPIKEPVHVPQEKPAPQPDKVEAQPTIVQPNPEIKYMNAHLRIEKYYEKVLPDNITGVRPEFRQRKNIPELVLPPELVKYLDKSFPDYRPVSISDYMDDEDSQMRIDRYIFYGYGLPFLLLGDFYGNGTIDIGIKLQLKKSTTNKNPERKYKMVLVQQNSPGFFDFHSELPVFLPSEGTMRLVPRGVITSHHEDAPLKMDHEGIEFGTEKASWIWYWQDGKQVGFITAD